MKFSEPKDEMQQGQQGQGPHGQGQQLYRRFLSAKELAELDAKRIHYLVLNQPIPADAQGLTRRHAIGIAPADWAKATQTEEKEKPQPFQTFGFDKPAQTQPQQDPFGFNKPSGFDKPPQSSSSFGGFGYG